MRSLLKTGSVFVVAAIALLAVGCGRDSSLTETERQSRAELKRLGAGLTVGEDGGLFVDLSDRQKPKLDWDSIARALPRAGNVTRISFYYSDPEFQDNDLTKRAFAIPTLRKLNLGYSGAKDSTLELLPACTHLEELWLVGSGVTDKAMDYICQCTSLRKLILESKNFTDTGLRCVGQLSQLQHLDISGTKVTDEGIKVLSDLKSLRTLKVGGASLTDAGMESIGQLAGLEELEINGDGISDAGFALLTRLSNLTRLHVYGKSYKLSDDGIAQLKANTKLEALIINKRYANSPGLVSLKKHLPRLVITHLGMK